QDPVTRDLIAHLREMKTTIPDGPGVQACGQAGLTPSPGPSRSAPDQTQIDGIYRFEVTDGQLTDAGVPAAALAENHGVFTWTLEDGRWCWEQQADTVLRNP